MVKLLLEVPEIDLNSGKVFRKAFPRSPSMEAILRWSKESVGLLLDKDVEVDRESAYKPNSANQYPDMLPIEAAYRLGDAQIFLNLALKSQKKNIRQT